jgi:hypothetical protein
MESEPAGWPAPVGSGLGARALRIETVALLQLGESTGQARRHGFETQWHGKLCEIRVLGFPPNFVARRSSLDPRRRNQSTALRRANQVHILRTRVQIALLQPITGRLGIGEPKAL